jgi:hypoxanthine phosphoribosyltransferase
MKKYISYNQIHKILQNMSQDILKSFDKIDYIIAVTGGGLIPSRILRTYLKCPIICIGVKLYNEDDNTINDQLIKYQWINDDLTNKNILIVDEVDDTRTTMTYIIKEIKKLNPKSINVSVIHNKIKQKVNEIPKECKYFVGETVDDIWIVYPWENPDIDQHNKLCN